MDVLLVILAAGTLSGLLVAGMMSTRGEIWRSRPRGLERRAGVHPGAARGGRELDPWVELRREIKRSRRTERPLTVLRIAGSPGPHQARDTAAILAPHVRDVDLVWVDDDVILLFLPDTGRAGVPALLRRLRAATSGALDTREVTWATFPDDALTADALVEHLRGSVRGGPRVERKPHASREGTLTLSSSSGLAVSPVGDDSSAASEALVTRGGPS